MSKQEIDDNHTKHIESDKNITDSTVFGPGMWYSIHSSAIFMDESCFIKYIKTLIPKIPCMICREHAEKYLQNHPIEQYIGIKNESQQLIGMFKWTWIFHNDVNYRLKKNIINYNTAYSMYANNSEVCSLTCGL